MQHFFHVQAELHMHLAELQLQFSFLPFKLVRRCKLDVKSEKRAELAW